MDENLPPPPLDPEDQCDSNPEFAIICSFISNFGIYIDLELNIEELKNSIEDQETLHDSLIDIHVKLIKKLRRYFVRDQWEKAIIRYAYEYSHADGFEIDSVGYLKTRPSIKLRVLRRLLDAQFECDPKFKAAVNLLEANKLNTKFAGRDNEGNTYWPCVDGYGNMRLYREEPLKYYSWVAICKNADDLKQLIEHLDSTKDVKVKGEPQAEPYDPYPEIYPELFVKKEAIPDKFETVVNKPSRKNTKKGKKKGRVFKKPKTIQTVSVNDETATQMDLKPILNSRPAEWQQPEPQDDRPRSTSPNESIESQVKHTLENIVNKVVSSFDFIFRRTSTEVKHGLKPENADDQKPKQSRKRVTKRERPQAEEPPRRSSSRIQQLQQKKIEEEAMKKQTNSLRMDSVAINISKEPINTQVKDKSLGREKRYKKDKQRWRNNKGRKKLSWDKDDSDLSSVSSLSESNDESFMEALNESIDHNEDDEFACEDEPTNDEPVIIKRARTARQALDLDETEGLNSIIEEDKPCGRCDKSNDSDRILLCDMCDDGYHTTCCVPSLMYVPDGDWFCPPCEQKMLLKKLGEILECVNEALANKERERLKKQRLRQPAMKKESSTKTDEILSTKRQSDILNELNEPLAVQALDDDLSSSPCEELPSSYREGCSRPPKKNTKKSKKRARQRYSSDEDESDYELDRRRRKKHSYIVSDSEFEEKFGDDEQEDEDFDDDELSDNSSDDGEQLRTRKARAFVSYKFEEYDELIQSAICGDSDGEMKIRGEYSNPEPCNIGRGKDMATIEALAYQQENGLTGGLNPTKQTKQRRRGRRLNDLDAESEIDIATSDESFQASSATEDLDDDDEATEVSSEDDSSMDEIVCMQQSRSKHKKGRTKKRKRYSDDSEDSDFKPRSRRVAAKKVSYKESTDDEDEIVAINTNQAPMTSNPINDLTEYCSQSSYSSNPLYSSFKMSPPHPQFYKEDEVRPITDDE